jgi:diguanylate cyclase (GGDEF)-like protein/hemerythrin-like metal-binding protein
MQFFQLDQIFQTGNAKVDEQHQHLVKIVNEFGKLTERNAAGPGAVEKVCSELLDYTKYHFAEEERLMATSGLDQRHLNQHRQQHEYLLKEIRSLRQDLALGDVSAGEFFFEFLVNWLVFHILGTDMLMARQIEAISQGRAASDTYLSEEHDNQLSTGLLLKAVKSLLYQVSSRNRQLAELNETLDRKVQERTCELTAANQKLRELASTDGLTGMLNRRTFMEEARNIFQLARRYHRPLSLLMVDVDHFKRVNDTYGHQVGDTVLVRLSQTMMHCLRGTDKIGRIGGEEFAVVLPETGPEQAAEMTERLLSTVRSMSIALEAASPLRVTVSIGVATLTPMTEDVDALIKHADAALYRAKDEGRDRWCGVP